MNAGCIYCAHSCTIAVPRAGGYAPFFFCSLEGQQWTHLMPGEPKPCHVPRGGGVIERTERGEPLLPVRAEDAP